MEITNQEVSLLEQELFQQENNINIWSLDLETIPRQLNSLEIAKLEEKIKEDYKPENLNVGNRSKPDTLEKFFAEKEIEKEQKLSNLGKGEAYDPSTNLIVSYSMAHYKIPDQKLIQQLKSSAQILQYNSIAYNTEELEKRILELNDRNIVIVDRILDRTKGDYPTEEDYKQFLSKLSGKLQSINQIITFNGDSFDIPTMKWAFLAYDIQIPPCLNNSKDIQWFFSRRDYSGKWIKPSLKSVVARYIGTEIFGDGSSVEEWWLAGELDKIVQHNQEDAIATLLLANKIFKVNPNYFRG